MNYRALPPTCLQPPQLHPCHFRGSSTTCLGLLQPSLCTPLPLCLGAACAYLCTGLRHWNTTTSVSGGRDSRTCKHTKQHRQSHSVRKKSVSPCPACIALICRLLVQQHSLCHAGDPHICLHTTLSPSSHACNVPVLSPLPAALSSPLQGFCRGTPCAAVSGQSRGHQGSIGHVPRPPSSHLQQPAMQQQQEHDASATSPAAPGGPAGELTSNSLTTAVNSPTPAVNRPTHPRPNNRHLLSTARHLLRPGFVKAPATCLGVQVLTSCSTSASP